jgi:hypothetical protein
MQGARRAIDAVAANDLCAMQTCGVRQVRCPLIGVSRTCASDGPRSEKCHERTHALQQTMSAACSQG